MSRRVYMNPVIAQYKLKTNPLPPHLQKPKYPRETPIKNWTIFIGDTVRVTQPDHPEFGKQGVVTDIIKVTNSVRIKNINFEKRTYDETFFNPEPVTLLEEAPIHVNSVSLIDPITKTPTKAITERVLNPLNRRTELRRFSETSNAMIPLPSKNYDDQTEGPLDTSPAVAVQGSWKPFLSDLPFPIPMMNALQKMKRKGKESHAF